MDIHQRLASQFVQNVRQEIIVLEDNKLLAVQILTLTEEPHHALALLLVMIKILTKNQLEHLVVLVATLTQLQVMFVLSVHMDIIVLTQLHDMLAVPLNIVLLELRRL